MTIKRLLLFVISMLQGFAFVIGQSFFTTDDYLINGYAIKISGTDFQYHSCIPGLSESILIRASEGRDFMEWETDPVPSRLRHKYATFIWISALGSSPGIAKMDLTVNDEKAFSFLTDNKSEWSYSNPDGSSLSFHSIMTDQFGDKHGYMVLRIPAVNVVRNKPLRIRVTGSNANLSSWYITFKKPLKTDIIFNPLPALFKTGKTLVEASIFHFGGTNEAKIYADNKLIEVTVLKFGYNLINLGLPAVSKSKSIKLKVVTRDYSMYNNVTLDPVRKWKVDFIQHVHTDIGYTRSQTEILAEHLRYIDYALDYCDATDNYPDNAKFRWTCEASWPVDEYLSCRPQKQVDRLLKRIKEGRIEVTGMYFNFDEIPDEQILASSLKAIGRIKSKGIPVNMAMQNDVNGIGWCVNDYLGQLGVKYLNMGTHGHRALICFDVPTMFWWESPSGNRLLTFRAEHYMIGNTVMEIQSGDVNKFKTNLLNYLANLASKKYPYDEVAIQHSGYLTDNSPPSTSLSDIIVKWNDIFEWPKISTSKAETFFSEMEKNHGNEFPVIRGAWPDWWTDGFGAGAREVATIRAASSSLMANTAGLSMALISGIGLPEKISDKIDLADNALLFFTEHTTGYSESVREPYSIPTMEQRAIKESYAWEANRRIASLGEETMGRLQSLFVSEEMPSLIVFNTLNWKRSGMVTIYIDHQIVPRGKHATIFDSNGTKLPVQATSHRSDGTYWNIWLSDIPPFGYKKFFIRAEASQEVDSTIKTGTLENQWYKLAIDLSKGVITSLYDNELNAELVDSSSKYKMCEFIHEKLTNRSQMERRILNDFSRSPLDSVWFDSAVKGEIWNSIKFYGESETAIYPRGYSIEIKLYNTTKKIDITCTLTKKSIIEPEGFYIAFPFKLEGGRHYTELQGGVIETGKDQIKGSSNDWYTIQNFSAVRNINSQIVFGSGEVPLAQFGAINTGRYIAGAMPQTTHLFSWPMNNYWVTNFNADQRGGHEWTYYLTSTPDVSNSFSTRFGWGSRVPFLSRVIPGGGKGDEMREGSFIEGWPTNIIIVNARPANDGKSILLHLRETDGLETNLNLNNGFTGEKLLIQETNLMENPVSNPLSIIRPLESKFYIISLQK